MGTLSNDEFNYTLNMAIIERQYGASKTNNSITSSQLKNALELYQKGLSCLESGNYAFAYESYSEALKLILGKGINDLEAACLTFLSLLLLAHDNEKEAIAGFSIAFKKAEDNLLKLSILNRMSIYYLTNNNKQKVIDICDLSLALIEQLPETNHTKYYQAASNYSKSEAYARDREYRDAIPFILAATKQFSEIGLKMEVAKCESLTGIIYTSTKQYADALFHLQNAIDVYQNQKDDDEMQSLLKHLGYCYIGLGKLGNGLAKLKEALPFAQKACKPEELNILLAEIASLEARTNA